MFVRPRGLPLWAGPVGCALVGFLVTVIDWDEVTSALGPLRDPLLFVAFAVPLAAALEAIGVFGAIAASFDGGRHLAAWLWLLAAGVVIVFNLDAAVVLLTPLYIRIARRHGLSAEALAFQPALLASLASSVLPVSNLTNLVVAEQFDLRVGDFLREMTLPTLAACAVGYAAYRATFRSGPPGERVDDPVDRAALARGLPIIAFVLVGFTVGDAVGIPAWVVAAIAAVSASFVARTLPWRSIPLPAVAVAAGLAVLVGSAVPHLGLERIFERSGTAGDLGVVAFGVVASNLTNNLPAVLAGSQSMVDATQAWPLLIGVNVGPALVLTASLSSLLWRDTARAMGVEVSVRRFSAVGFRVGLPAIVVGAVLVCVV